MIGVVETREISSGWELARTPPRALTNTEGLQALDWSPARVPGTVVGALPELDENPDEADWWFRTRFESRACAAGERLTLKLGGVATISEVFLNGAQILSSRSMFATHELDVSAAIAEFNELAICCRALTPELAAPRRPRARWRTGLVDGNLRFFRTMLLGRAPGFAPGPAVVGPWRSVTLTRTSGFTLGEVWLRPSVGPEGDGLLRIGLIGDVTIGTPPASLKVFVVGPTGKHDLNLPIERSGDRLIAGGGLRIPNVARWWPHTHGEPVLYTVSIDADGTEIYRTRAGFRLLEWRDDWAETGLALRINGVDIFARGAVWTPLDMAAPDQPRAAVRQALEQVVTAGMNMVRIPGTACYESDAFHDLCDELGVLLWQDFMLANLDYPVGEPDWHREFETEVRRELGRLSGRPSLAVLCGGSEVAQQVAMLGLDPQLACGPLYLEVLPRLISEAGAAVPYIPNAPWGGTLPFRPDRGVANYYGVGAYLRELDDSRRAQVKFASECLAFSNVPESASLSLIETSGQLVPHHPAWKAGVPRDAGAGWDFEDVRDHYLRVLYGEDPVQLRWSDVERYLELSRAVTGEVMAEVFGDWRRLGAPCAGGLILWLRDLKPGAGWGIVDSFGRPKAAYHYLRRALAPVAVWITDEGLGGMMAHIANDTSATIRANLRVALYRDHEVRVDEATVPIELGPHSASERDLEGVIGRFVDINCAYRFGPPGHDVVAVSLEPAVGSREALISNAFRFPTERPIRRETASRLELEAVIELGDPSNAALRLRARRLVHGVRVHVPGWAPADDAFTLEPGVDRVVALSTRHGSTAREPPFLTALNLFGRVQIASVSGA